MEQEELLSNKTLHIMSTYNFVDYKRLKRYNKHDLFLDFYFTTGGRLVFRCQT